MAGLLGGVGSFTAVSRPVKDVHRLLAKTVPGGAPRIAPESAARAPQTRPNPTANKRRRERGTSW